MEFTEENILFDLKVSTQEELFEAMAAYAEKINVTNEAAKVCEAFLEREKEYSTGLQTGFAIPHAKSPYVLKPTVLFIRLETGIKWETFDDSDVQNIFALLVPKEDEGKLHLEMLSRLATALMEEQFIQQVQENTSKTDLMKLINNEMNGEKSI